MEEKKQKKNNQDQPGFYRQTNKEVLSSWYNSGLLCDYARFQAPVPPSLNKEPVGEFKLISHLSKYVVESMSYTPHGLIWKQGGEMDITPLANVQYARLIQ